MTPCSPPQRRVSSTGLPSVSPRPSAYMNLADRFGATHVSQKGRDEPLDEGILRQRRPRRRDYGASIDR